MFFDRHFDQASGALDSLLESGDATFFTVVLDASVVQEVGMDSTNVVQFLTSNENLTKLLEFALDPVSCEVQVAEDSNYELPEDTTIGELSLRCHNILSALNLDLLSAIGKNESHLAYIFSRLPNKTSKESIPAIFHITTVLHNILSHTPQDIVAYIKENPRMTLEVLLANLNISDIIPIMELLVTFEVDVTRWLVQEAYLVERLRKVLCTKALCEQNIAKEDSGGGKMFAEHFEVQVNALRFIMTLLDLTTGSEQAIRAEPLVQELVSPVFMKCLLYEGVSSMHSSARYISWLVPCIEKILSLWKQQTQNSKSPANLTTHLLPDLKATTPENEALGIGLVHHCKVNSNMRTSESRRLCGMARVQLYQLASILAEYGAGAFLLTHHVDTCAVQCLFAFPNHSILLCTITRLLTTLLEYPQEDIARSTWNRCQEGLSQWIAGDLNNANRRTTSGGHALELTTVLLGMIKRFHIAEDELPEPVQIYLETTYAKCISLQKEPLLGIVAKSCRGAIDLDDLEEAETNVLQLQDPFQLTRFQSSKQEHHNEPHHVDPVSLIDQESEKKDVDIWSVALNTATPGEKIEDGARQDASNGSPLKRAKPDDQNCVAGKNSSVYFKGQNNQHENVLQAVQFRDPFAIDFSSEKPDGFTAASDSLGVDFMGGGTDPLSSSSSEDEFDVVFRSGPSSPRIDAPTTLQQDPISVLNSEVSPDTHFPDDPLSFLDQTSGTNKILERVTQNERLNLGTGVGSPRLRLGCATQAPQGQLSKSESNSPKANHGKQDRIPNETDHSLLGFEPHTSKKIFTDSTHSKLNFKESTPRDTDNAKRNVAQSLEDLLAANLDALFNTTYPVDTQKKNKPKTPLHQSVTGNAHVHDSSQLQGHPNAEAMQIHDNAVPDWFNIAANGTGSSSSNHLNAMSSVDQKLPSSNTGPHFLTAADLWSVSSTYSNNSGAVSPGLFEDIISSGMTITNELNVNTSQKPDDFLGNFDECTMAPKAPSFKLQEDPLDKWVHFTDG